LGSSFVQNGCTDLKLVFLMEKDFRLFWRVPYTEENVNNIQQIIKSKRQSSENMKNDQIRGYNVFS